MADTGTVDKLDFTLSRELDLLAAEALKNDLLELLHKEGPLDVNASEVERVATPCIEVLVAAAAAFKDSGREFQISQPSSSLCDAFEALGLADRLEMWRAS
jgi:chemotaxis protein CheX